MQCAGNGVPIPSVIFTSPTGKKLTNVSTVFDKENHYIKGEVTSKETLVICEIKNKYGKDDTNISAQIIGGNLPFHI